MASYRAPAQQAVKYLLGTCMPTVKKNTSRIRIRQLELDNNLLMYFNSYKFVFAYDPRKLCKTGDIVLIQSLPERMSKLIGHKVIDVVYPLGDIIDPITGKPVVMANYREDTKNLNELYGESPDAFDYESHPKRGTMQGIRDFSHKTGFVKYHEDPNENLPHAL